MEPLFFAIIDLLSTDLGRKYHMDPSAISYLEIEDDVDQGDGNTTTGVTERITIPAEYMMIAGLSATEPNGAEKFFQWLRSQLEA